MKKITVMTMAFLLACQGIASAHPPSAIDAKIAGTKVDVTVRHGVSDPKSHYIKQITLTVAGKKVADRSFTSQTDGNKQVASLDVPSLKKGDTVTIEADCSRSGNLKKEFAVK